jgi:pilus assembly protein CpaB
MNKNLMIVMGGALVVAVLVAMLVQVTLGGKKKQEAQIAKVEILVAAKDLGIGSDIKPDAVRWQEWPKASLFPGAIIKDGETEAVKAATGRVIRAIAKGEPVTRTALSGQSRGNMVAASLQPGMRAVAIEVSAAAMVGGFLTPGDYVDVILNYKGSFRGDGGDERIKAMMSLSLDKTASETILQSVRVLAVDQTAKRAPEDEKAKVGKTVTLAVNAQDAEKLSLAQKMGDLTLSLRPPGDQEIVKKTWRTISDARLISVDDEVFLEYVKLQKDAGINPNTVKIYNGSTIQLAPTHGGSAAPQQ